jgi:hypothetical protein
MVSELVFSLIRCLAHLALEAMLEMHLAHVTLEIGFPGKGFFALRASIRLSAALPGSGCRCGIGKTCTIYRAAC